jgi:hypothetical protein
MAVLGLYTSALVCIRRAEPLLENNTKKVWDFLCDFVFCLPGETLDQLLVMVVVYGTHTRVWAPSHPARVVIKYGNMIII